MRYATPLFLGLKDFFLANFNTVLQAVAATTQQTVPNVNYFANGAEDVFSLKKYPGMLFIPGPRTPDMETQLSAVSVDLIAIVQGPSEAAVAAAQAVYADAIFKIVTDMPTFGGLCDNAQIDGDIDPMIPVQGLKLAGIVMARIRCTLDERA